MNQRTYQRYTPEFKDQALGLLSLGKPVAEVAQELQLSSNLLYAWRSQRQRTQGSPKRTPDTTLTNTATELKARDPVGANAARARFLRIEATRQTPNP